MPHKLRHTIGLPPMELAETVQPRNATPPSNTDLIKCSNPKKMAAFFIIVLIGIGCIWFILYNLAKDEEAKKTNVIVATGSRSMPYFDSMGNKYDINYVYILKNRSQSKLERRKRAIKKRSNVHYNSIDKIVGKFTEKDFQKARKIISNNDKPCQPGNEDDICKNIVQQLDQIKDRQGTNDKRFNNREYELEKAKGKSDSNLDKKLSTEHAFKRDTLAPIRLREGYTRTTPTVEYVGRSASDGHINLNNNYYQLYPGPMEGHHHPVHNYPPTSDNCLLVQLLKQNNPHVNMDHMNHDIHNTPPLGLPMAHQQDFSNNPWIHARENDDMQERKHHPQDIDIFMRYKTKSPLPFPKNNAREADCEDGMISCKDGSQCILQSQVCDGKVECQDVSDEMHCSCRSLVHKSRLCDGFYDCPFGEDEMGCEGCMENEFSCENLDENFHMTCFTKEQRCNGIHECYNGKDELECNLLAPSLHEKPLFAISHTEGYLQRNFKGSWYAVCRNPYMWAHDACLRETGLIVRPPDVKLVPIDPLLRPYYLNNGPGHTMHMSDTCFNSSAFYVTCPGLLCGTRVQTTSQLLRQSPEYGNRLYGRNKRYLCNIYPSSKYCNRRMKRQSSKVDSKEETAKLPTGRLLKRSEGRVVGGKPSEPAAWPWMVAIYRDGSFVCGGVILTQRWIMSAAHCVMNFWESYYEVQVGMLRRFSFSPQEQTHQVSHIIVNQNYDKQDMKNDLCLLKVKPSILFNRWVRPICLPGMSTAGPDWMTGPQAGVTCTAVGWGAIKEKGPGPDHMREVEVPIWNLCNHKADRAGNEICAGYVEGGKDTCQGDSGGPLLCKNPNNPQQWYVAGIVSHGDGCAQKGEPGVYTRVSLFVKWIQYNINSKSLPTITPKQDCPGFRCMSRISKCLPKTRICDKFVDCLDGEDEKECNLERTIQDNTENILLSSDFKYIDYEITDKNTSIKRDHNIPNDSERNANNEFSNDIITTTAKKNSSKANSNITGPNHINDILINNKPNRMADTPGNISKNIKSNETYINENSITTTDNIVNDLKSSNSSIKEISNSEDINNNTDTIISTTQISIEGLPSHNDSDLDISENTIFTSNNVSDKSIENVTDDTTYSSESEEETEVKQIKKTNTQYNKSVEIENPLNTNTSKQFRRADIPESENLPSSLIKHESFTHDIDEDKSNQNLLDDSEQSITPPNDNFNSNNNTNGNIDTNDLDKEQDGKNIDTNDLDKDEDSKHNIIKNNLNINNSSMIMKPTDTIDTISIVENKVLINNSLPTDMSKNKDNTTNNINVFNDTNQDFDKFFNISSNKINDVNISHLNSNQIEESTDSNLDKDDITQESKTLDIDLSPHTTDKTTKMGLDEESKSSYINFGKDKRVLLGQKLLPAKMKKTHQVPEHFECRRIPQLIPYKHRCDHNPNCEDGTDELGCTCVDYITTFDDSLLCDNQIDCADGQDEMNCYGCSDQQFLCKWSQNCLPSKFVCDGKPHCPQGEDELDCYALSNGRNIICDIDGRPKVNLEGYLTRKHQNKWNIVCEDNLSLDQQEEAAKHMCRYLGFNSANRFFVKYINIKENDIKSVEKYVRKRDASEIPIEFIFKESHEPEARHIVIKDPQIIKEECVPNITKTCMSLYVYCEHSLFTDFSDYSATQFKSASFSLKYENKLLPWVSKVYVEGDYRCSGILIDLSWVLVSESCLWDTLLIHHYVSVVLGSQRTLSSTSGPYEQIHQVDAKKDIYSGRVTLLHLKNKSHYTSMVKPMITSTYNPYSLGKKDVCIAVGQDLLNNTVKVYLEEMFKCSPGKRCFRRVQKEPICDQGSKLSRPWSGIISCHAEHGWFPSATFIEPNGECGVYQTITGYNIEDFRLEIKHYIASYNYSSNQTSAEVGTDDYCNGHRCTRGRCVLFARVCDGVRNCEDGNDESEMACAQKHNVCSHDPFQRGCDCTSGQLKCRSGRCISKDLFSDGHDDCGDGSDEPKHATCAYYLARTAPKRLCDGILQCSDRSDEDPMFCKCFAKISYKCGKDDECVAPDLVCDGVSDCSNGEDEKKCVALRAPEGSAYGTGEVIVRSHGVWHTKCFDTKNHTKTQLEEICKKLGFQSGHAKQLKTPEKLYYAHTKVIVDQFSKVILNNYTTVLLRNSDMPIARVVLNEDVNNCHPLFIECL